VEQGCHWRVGLGQFREEKKEFPKFTIHFPMNTEVE
jgi:hypothetical protein